MALPDLKAGLLANIARLMNPTAQSLAESDTNAAQASLASGVPAASQFGANRQLVLRDSEQAARVKLANDMYQPLLQIESSEKIAAEGQAGEDRRLAVSGQQAMERLRLSESGESARLSSQQAAALQQQAIEGEQAMARLNASNVAESGRQATDLASRERIQTQEIGSRENIARMGIDIARMGIDADTARQAVSEAGLNSRLSTQASQELQLAIVRGDQARQLQILSDAGADNRQVLALQNALQQQRLQGEQQMRLQQAGNQADIQRQILAAYLQPQQIAASPGAPAQYRQLTDPFTGVGSVQEISPASPARPARTTSPALDSGMLDRLLAQYGIMPSPNLSQYPR